MHSELGGMPEMLAAVAWLDWLYSAWLLFKVLIGFSIIIFVHELGHFLAAKSMGVRVDRFSIGFFYRLVGYRKGEGITFGNRPALTSAQLNERGYGETDYCIKAFPFGGYVKMLGEDDILINEETGEIKHSEDPRAFTNKKVWQRMVVVSAGVIFNILFAILVYAAVFMGPGHEVIAPYVGSVAPGSPSAVAGLKSGDEIVAVNGEEVASFRDAAMYAILSKGPLTYQVRRGDQLRTIEADLSRAEGRERLDITPMYTMELGPVAEKEPPGLEGRELKPGDQITHINGVRVDRMVDLLSVVQYCEGEPLRITVKRTEEDGSVETFDFVRQPQLHVQPTRHGSPRSGAVADSEHLLGLLRRRVIVQVDKGTPADEAGFKVDDVIARWGSVSSPKYGEIIESIHASAGQPIEVVVERDGEPVKLEVAPKPRFSLMGSGELFVGLGFETDNGRPVVADVVPNTPAAAIGMPRGAELVTIDDRPVDDWLDVYETFEGLAGSEVSVRYRTGERVVEGRMRVPSSITSELGLAPEERQIVSIAGEKKAWISDKTEVSLPSPIAVAAILKQHVGETVEVEYYPTLEAAEAVKRSFTVTEENWDPWQLRVNYRLQLASLEFKTSRISAGGNPIRAISMGIEETVSVLMNVYYSIKRMAENTLTRSGGVGVQDVHGPVGIMRVAHEEAAAGFGELAFFLAFISVNLAVINFLPLPVVDGGLMLFLIIEWIRGKPLNLKVQVIATLAGLALIVLTFVFVTLQDIVKWIGGGL